MEEKRLTVEKKGIFGKIKEFFQNLFSKKEIKNIQFLEEKEQGTKEILIPENFEELRIMNIQEKYREGNLLLEGLSKEDFEKLVELYQKQNKQLEKQIEEAKKRGKI